MSTRGVGQGHTAEPIGPVRPSERIALLDVLRGFALIGVLYVNMHNFGAWEVTGPLHSSANFFQGTFFGSKFFSLFSLLFGMGFAIQMQRAEARGTSLLRFYWRRLVILFVLGWAHALIYAGDIVRLYAVLGFLLLLFRKWSPRRLTAIALFIVLGQQAVWTGVDLLPASSETPIEAVQAIAPNDPTTGVAEEDPHEARLRVFAEGSLSEVIVANLVWHDRWISMFIGYGPSALALFLFGMAIIKGGILHRVDAHRRAIRTFAWSMLLIGLPAEALSNYVWAFDVEVESRFLSTTVGIFGELGNPALMFAYASFIALYLSTPRWHRLMHPLAAVGRVALTVYIGQSVIYTTIFHGYGFGMFFKLGPAHILPLAAVIFAVEVIVCNWWVRRFRFGPLEWLWRSATYMKWQPMALTSTR